MQIDGILIFYDHDEFFARGRGIAFVLPRGEMSEVVSHCLPHKQMWVRVAMQWLEVD